MLVLILIVLVVGFIHLGRKINAMREDIRADLDALHEQLTETETVTEGVVALIDSQNAKLRELADSDKDADEIATELRALADESEAVKAKLANAVAANTAATSDDKPVEQPLPEPETTAEQPAGGDGTGAAAEQPAPVDQGGEGGAASGGGDDAA